MSQMINIDQWYRGLCVSFWFSMWPFASHFFNRNWFGTDCFDESHFFISYYTFELLTKQTLNRNQNTLICWWASSFFVFTSAQSVKMHSIVYSLMVLWLLFCGVLCMVKESQPAGGPNTLMYWWKWKYKWFLIWFWPFPVPRTKTVVCFEIKCLTRTWSFSRMLFFIAQCL